MNLKIYKMDKGVSDVKYGTADSACFDISANLRYGATLVAFSMTNEQMAISVAQDDAGKDFITIPGGWRVLIPTGLILDIPQKHSVRVYPRSGLSTKKGLNLINGVGMIDSDYVEEVFVPLMNESQDRVRVYHGDRIAQAELMFNEQAQLSYIQERPQRKSDRSGGFGSTGVS
jgi:dUTP pyrophosphatase